MSKDILALRALALRLFAERLKHADAQNRAAIKEEFHVKDREVVWLQLDGQDVEVGHVRVDKGSVTASVVGMGELIDWVEANHPTEVEEYRPAPVTRVRPAFLDRLLANAKTAGVAVDDNGEVIPGIEVTTGDPKTVVVPAKTVEATAALVEAMRAPGSMQSLLQLPDGVE